VSSYSDWIGRNVPDVIMEDAAAWMALLDSPDCSAADRVSFARWLSEDPMHRWAFEELSEVWARLRSLTDMHELADQPDVIRFPENGIEERIFPESREVCAASKFEWSTVAAVLVLVVGIVFHVVTATSAQVHETRTGEVQAIALEDGSNVSLNSRSGLEVRIDDKRRTIRLRDGEAVFHVARDDRPFIVKTDLATVSAVGTVFSVNAQADTVAVSVLEGLVSVSSGRSATALTEYDSHLLVRFSDEIALLGAGQRLELTRESQRFETVSSSRIIDDLSWRDGEIVFSETPLVTALVEMRRHIGSRIFIGDPRLNNLRISGRFPTHSPESFLARLSDDFGVVVVREHENMIVLQASQPAE
jgi:transmembrane sensor